MPPKSALMLVDSLADHSLIFAIYISASAALYVFMNLWYDIGVC